MRTFDEEMQELGTKQSKHPDQAKKIIYLFHNRAGHCVSVFSQRRRLISTQSLLGAELGLEGPRMNRAYWGLEKIQEAAVRTLAIVYDFDPALFELSPDEFIFALGGWAIKWDQAIELAEAVKDPVQIVGFKNEIRKQKKMRLSQYPNETLDDIQTVTANASFQWKLNCKGLFLNLINDTGTSASQVFAFEYDSRAELVQTATLLPGYKIADAGQFFKKEHNDLWWIFPELTAKVFPQFPEDDVKKTIDLLLFVFKDGEVEDDLRNDILSTAPLKITDPIVRRFSSTFHAAATKGEKRAAAIRSRVRVVSR